MNPLRPLPPALVQVVGPTDGWILERLARTLARRIPYADFVPWRPQPNGHAVLAYYVNYALYANPSGMIDVGFYTHLDESHGFLARAQRMDCCVCMARTYANWLTARGVHIVRHIPMGFDSYRYRPSLVLGVVGKLDHPRKGRHLVDRVRQLPFVEVVATEGEWPEERLRELYQRVDYVLIPATVEGGPLCLLEGLAMGRPVIAPEGVGLVPEFDESASIIRYPRGDAEALVARVTECYQAKLSRAQVVADRDWDRWAEDHHHLFMKLMRERGVPVPQPGRSFRFGMMRELEIPLTAKIEQIEEVVNRSARYLYYGRSQEARAGLEEIVEQCPSVVKLIRSIH